MAGMDAVRETACPPAAHLNVSSREAGPSAASSSDDAMRPRQIVSIRLMIGSACRVQLWSRTT